MDIGIGSYAIMDINEVNSSEGEQTQARNLLQGSVIAHELNVAMINFTA